MDNLVIDTPEQIPLEFPLAGIGSRFLALALDTLIQFAAGVVLGIVALAVGLTSSKLPTHGAWTLALMVFLGFLLQSGYFAFFEAIWNGQTPGKRMTHLRVIQDSGRPITVYEAVARNLLRVIDSIPGLYGVGIISALLSAKSKRLGDYVAGRAPWWSMKSPRCSRREFDGTWPPPRAAPGTTFRDSYRRNSS
jgi:uncharacterized RDD family membrane protein YckC